MSAKIVQRPDLTDAKQLTLVIALSCRDLRGFLFMWMNIISFMRETKRAAACSEFLPGISSPFHILLVSYWTNEEGLQAFVRSKAHVRWMKFIYRHPNSLNLFNETYAAPVSANFINSVRGYAKSLSQ
jgi:hypothetical protein